MTITTPMPAVRIENTGPAAANVPFTFGQTFVRGQVPGNSPLDGRLAGGAVVSLQVDSRSTWPDGSLAFAVLSGKLAKIEAAQSVLMTVQPAMDVVPMPMVPFAKAAGLAAPSATLTIDGVVYTAAMAGAQPPKGQTGWLDGPIVREWYHAAPLVGPSGPHPHLTVRFGVRAYGSTHTQIETVLENTKTFAPGARNFTYDLVVTVGGKAVLTEPGLVHWHHARGRHVAWVGVAPTIVVHPDTAYLFATRVASNYDLGVKPAQSALDFWIKKAPADKCRMMRTGPIEPGMPMTGGRPDIAPLPGWAVNYLLSQDLEMRRITLAGGDGAASFQIHYRDENTGYPVRTDNPVNAKISLHMNMANQGPLPVPRTVAGQDVVGMPGSTLYQPDTAHQPSMAFVPYLLTGDYYYLEELHFWAAWNPIVTAAGNHGNGQGLVRWQQLRGQAWSMRTLGHAAFITPDDHPMKAYFAKQLDNNLDYYHKIFVVANPNKLGMYDGSGEGAFTGVDGGKGINGSAPWQDDFQVWSFGYLLDLGFEKARPILKWRGRYIVNRMTSPDFCWWHGADYYLSVRKQPYVAAIAGKAATATTAAVPPVPATPASPIYETMGEIYRANFGGPAIKNDARFDKTHPDGKLYIDQPFYSQAQADWITAAFKQTWPVGRMFGYADSVEGFPSNMQPALAILVDHGIEGAAQAWLTYESRANKPDYRKGAQWNVVPRVPVVSPPPPVVVAPPVVTAPPAEPVYPKARKVGGSYQADGVIVSTFSTRGGLKRHVFEFDVPRGMLHIFGPEQVEITGAATSAAGQSA